jgi:DNA modification methylase
MGLRLNTEGQTLTTLEPTVGDSTAAEENQSAKARRGTSTSNFGVGARESHDASGFYNRFRPPDLSSDDTVLAPAAIAQPVVCGDARHMHSIPDGSVALVVTSPPYFAGKQYEEELERDGVPASYLEYLQLLTDVFAECVRKLEPGGRIAVNVANLGRKPYRSLSADVIRILEHDLGLLLRGELVWQKAEGASGSCAWGSFRSASNPVLRDITERVIIASKGRFDRARTVKQRAAEGLPHESTMLTEDFMALTLDVWSIPPESARRVGHPAPFPVELPEQLIRLYTYADDLVIDPFMGAGSTLMAAKKLGRRFAGYDTDPAYVELANRRINEITMSTYDKDTDEFRPAGKIAEEVITAAGFVVTGRNKRIAKTGVAVSFTAKDQNGFMWFFDVPGANTTYRGGLLTSDSVWKSLGRAMALRGRFPAVPLILLSPQLPKPTSEGDVALRAAGPDAFFDAVAMFDEGARRRLSSYSAGGVHVTPQTGYWTAGDLARRNALPLSNETDWP